MQMASGETAAPSKEASGFEPSVWGEFFIHYELKPLQRSEEWMRHKAQKLREDVRTLFSNCNDVVGQVKLVDAVQHLGIDHLFKGEIAKALSDINGSEFTSSSLHEVALWFSLLREHGFFAPPDAFNKFKGNDGRFDIGIFDEPKGLLTLYNAAHLLTHDEPELEEAITLAGHHLKSLGQDIDCSLANQVKRALHLPLPRAQRRVEALHYMLEYEQEDGHSAFLLNLAKLDFNLLQHVHLNELKSISEWGKNLYGYIGLSYVRDRIVECYTWSYTVFYEEEFSLTRMIFAKIVGLITIMDDTYDSHATIQECRRLNAAIQRWDDNAISLLPEYLKKFYHRLLNNFKEFEDLVGVNEKYRVVHTIKEFQKLSTYFLQEAEWAHQKYKPCFEDQVILSTMSSAVPLLCVCAMLGIDEEITNELFEWVASNPSAVKACAKIARFMNDIAAFKQGKNRGDVASSVECYMNEYKVVGEIACAKIDSLVEDEWRTMNKARFVDPILLPAAQRVVKLTISMPFFYDDRKDAFTFGTCMKKVIDSLFVKPIPI